jgi:hypothetical protein
MANFKEDTKKCKVLYNDWEKKDKSLALYFRKEGKH